MVFVDITVKPVKTKSNEWSGTWKEDTRDYVLRPRGRSLIPFHHTLVPLQSPLAVWFNIDEELSAVAPNRCIAEVTRDCYPPSHTWYGPILILKYADDTLVDVADIVVSDLDVVHTYFQPAL